MVDFDCKTKVISPDTSLKSPKSKLANGGSSSKLQLLVPTPPFRCNRDLAAASAQAVSAYELYVRLPELRKLWTAREFPDWKSEPLLRPALQALEITFRFVSTALSDPRAYTNRSEWKRRLESVAASQVELVAALIENEEAAGGGGCGSAPVFGLSSACGALARRGSSSLEVWKIPGEATTAVSRASESSLLPRLAAWQRSEDVAQKILYAVECAMRRCPYTLGLGEPNLGAKPILQYDAVCKPDELHALKRSPNTDQSQQNHENQSLHTTYQILESWIQTSRELLKRILGRIESKEFEIAASDCYVLERIWKLLAEIEDLHMLMDPEDLMRLIKRDLAIRKETASFCFRSKGLVEITRESKDGLKHKVPYILDVEVDPNGGPRLQEAAMRLYCEKGDRTGGSERIHLLQAMQAVEAAVKRFYFAYKQVVVVALGSLEARGDDRVATAVAAVSSSETRDSLSQVFLENTYFPSLDAAKTFLGEMLMSGGGGDSGGSSDRRSLA